ncbi:MAG: hypothetical protein EBR26_02475 [Microbacteriaceae bacterium]|nr:hypothetical protein [Microbacteriaceae bacterium]
MNSAELKEFVNDLYTEISNLVSTRAEKALTLLPRPTKTTEAIAKNIQTQSSSSIIFCNIYFQKDDRNDSISD